MARAACCSWRSRPGSTCFATGAPGVFAAASSMVASTGRRRTPLCASGSPPRRSRRRQCLDAAGGHAGEVFSTVSLFRPIASNNCAPRYVHVGAHAHLGHDLRQPLAHGLHVVVDGLVRRQIAGQVLVDRRSVSIARYGCTAWHRSRRVRRSDQLRAPCRSTTRPAVVRKPSRTRCWWIEDSAGEAGIATRFGPTRRSLMIRMFLPPLIASTASALVELGFDTLMTPFERVGDVQRVAAELAVGVLDIAQFGHISGEVQHRLADFQAHRRVDLVDVQQIGLGSDERYQRRDDRFANGFDRRIRHLSKQLLEVVVDQLRPIAEHGQRRVITHRAERPIPSVAIGAIRIRRSSSE